ncbi:MAG: glutamine-hydrolyzing GMP synthase, partial [bacterium]
MQQHDKVIILDFGAQYSQLIARRVRECNVYSEIVPYDITPEKIKALKPKGIIYSGGPSSVYEKNAPHPNPAIWDMGIPILGICYGLQLIVEHLGGKVGSKTTREYGRTEIHVEDQTDIFAGTPIDFISWMSHGDSAIKLPDGFKSLARTKGNQYAAIGNAKDKIYGVQFHPEVSHTENGKEIIKNFLLIVCGCSTTWTTQNFIEESVSAIRKEVGKENILCALSGGVDSTTVSALVHRAVGDQLTCMFIDQGFMRKDEPKKIKTLFDKFFKINLLYIDASERFYKKLAGVTDPEEKRHAIGNEFIRTFEEEAKKLGHIPFLAQGTLYPDVIESAVPGKSATTAVRI